MWYIWPSFSNYGKDYLSKLELDELQELCIVKKINRIDDNIQYKYKPDLIIKTVKIGEFNIYKSNNNEIYNFYMNRSIIPLNNIKPRHFIIYNNNVYNLDKFIINTNDIKFKNAKIYLKGLIELNKDKLIYKYSKNNHKEFNEELTIENLVNNIDKVYIYNKYNNNIIDYDNCVEYYNFVVNGIKKIESCFNDINTFLQFMISTLNTDFYEYYDIHTQSEIKQIDKSKLHIYNKYKKFNIICMIFMTMYHDKIDEYFIKNSSKYILNKEELSKIIGDEYVNDNCTMIESINKYLMLPENRFEKITKEEYDDMYKKSQKHPKFITNKNTDIYPIKFMLFGSGGIVINWWLIVIVVVVVIVVIVVVVVIVIKNKYNIKIFKNK